MTLVLVSPVSDSLSHFLCGALCACASSPTSASQPTNKTGCYRRRETDTDGQEKCFVDGVREDDHGPDAFRPSSRSAGCAVHFISPRFGRSRRKETNEDLLHGGGKASDVFGTEYVDSDERDGKVCDSEEGIHA